MVCTMPSAVLRSKLAMPQVNVVGAGEVLAMGDVAIVQVIGGATC